MNLNEIGRNLLQDILTTLTNSRKILYIIVFLEIMPFCVLDGSLCFDETCCLRLQIILEVNSANSNLSRLWKYQVPPKRR
jgi:hypothetical protein